MVSASVFFTALVGATVVFAQNCSLNALCPESAPCCSQYGQCGVGAYCLGGCDPRMSYSLDSCTPEPVCQNKVYNMTDTSRIVDISNYLGDASTADWVSSGTPLVFGDSLLLTMAANSPGTVLASTDYIWYGHVTGTFKTSRGAGVITAFILLSDIKDEIDYEFVGVDLNTAQTNYYWQGVLNYTNSGNISVSSDSFENFHTYEIIWTPDSLQWLVDGVVGRTRFRNETWNATTNQWMYPQTPSRLEISIWPGGAASNAQGTIDWAGGAINWDSEDIQANGYDYATFKSISVECYGASSGPGTNSGKSYTYNSLVGTNDTVVDGTKDTVLNNLLDTGLNMTAGAKAGASSSGAASQPTSGSNSVPGQSNSGTGTVQGGGDSSSNSDGTDSSSAPSSTETGWSQGSGSSTTGTKSGAEKLGSQERVLKGSLFAVIIAVVAMIAL